MEKFKDFRKSGSFKLAAGPELAGDLVLSGGATLLSLYSKSFFNTHGVEDIFGHFHDRTKISLVNCVTMTGPGSGTRGREKYHFATVFPHFVLIGGEHVGSADRKIVGVSFSVDDAPSIFYDFQTFGMVLEAGVHMQRIAQSEDAGRTIEVGEDPHIFYFNGKREIFSAKTAIGTVSASNGISYGFPSPKGIHVDNTIRINVTFEIEHSVKEAINAVQDTLRLFEVIAGRPQNIVELAFHLTPLKDERPRLVDVYWSLPPRRERDDESRSPQPADLPLQPGMAPDKFTPVLVNWLERQREWRTARARFSTAAAHQNRYTTDRLVGAANMFDIMPEGAFPSKVTLSVELEKARDDARKAFKALPQSAEQESVLGALGRIGKPTLKNKIRKRVELLTNLVGSRFPDLTLVTDQAVVCRNFYVHGSPGKFDYEIHSQVPPFFTDTLEFVFAASDLIEAGWDIAAWMKEGSSRSHPFGRYCESYLDNLDALKKLLPAAA